MPGEGAFCHGCPSIFKNLEDLGRGRNSPVCLDRLQATDNGPIVVAVLRQPAGKHFEHIGSSLRQRLPKNIFEPLPRLYLLAEQRARGTEHLAHRGSGRDQCWIVVAGAQEVRRLERLQLSNQEIPQLLVIGGNRQPWRRVCFVSNWCAVNDLACVLGARFHAAAMLEIFVPCGPMARMASESFFVSRET